MKAIVNNVAATVIAAAIIGIFTIFWSMAKDISDLKSDVAVIKKQIEMKVSLK